MLICLQLLTAVSSKKYMTKEVMELVELIAKAVDINQADTTSEAI